MCAASIGELAVNNSDFHMNLGLITRLTASASVRA